MVLLTDSPVNAPVTVTLLGRTLVVTTASLVRLAEDEVELVAPSLELEVGARVILTVDARTRLHGRVLAKGCEGRVTVSRDGAHADDDRSAPRVMAKVHVSWRLAADRDDRRSEQAWLDGGVDPRPFTVYDGLVDLSVSGILLPPGGAPPPPVGARLRIELRLYDDEPVRVIGVARRHDPSGGRVGVEFVEIGDSDAAHLSAFTLAHA